MKRLLAKIVLVSAALALPAAALPTSFVFHGVFDGSANGIFAPAQSVNLTATFDYDDMALTTGSPAGPVAGYDGLVHWEGNVGAYTFDWTGNTRLNMLAPNQLEFYTQQAITNTDGSMFQIGFGAGSGLSSAPDYSSFYADYVIEHAAYTAFYTAHFPGDGSGFAYGPLNVPEAGVLGLLEQF